MSNRKNCISIQKRSTKTVLRLHLCEGQLFCQNQMIRNLKQTLLRNKGMAIIPETEHGLTDLKGHSLGFPRLRIHLIEGDQLQNTTGTIEWE